MARGQIIERKTGFTVRVFVGRDAAGERIYRNQRVTGTKKDAQKVMTAMLRKLDTGELLLEPTQVTVQEYLEHWLEISAQHRLEAGSFDSYKDNLRRNIYPFLGKTKLSRLDMDDIQKRYNVMLSKGLSPPTVRYTHTIFSGALTQAVKRRMLPKNPAQYVDLPKMQSARDEDTVVKAVSHAQSEAFLEAARQGRFYSLFAVMLGTGLRPSEVYALMWEDFDAARATLSVKRSYGKVKGGCGFKPPKTKKSRRSIKLPEYLVRLLLELRDASTPKCDLIFPSLTGTPLKHDNVVSRHYHLALQRAGLGTVISTVDKRGKPVEKFVPDFTLYGLRHTHAPLLLKVGVNPKIVSERLGHSSVAFTLDVYSHVLPDMQDGAAEALNTMLWDNQGAEGKHLPN